MWIKIDVKSKKNQNILIVKLKYINKKIVVKDLYRKYL